MNKSGKARTGDSGVNVWKLEKLASGEIPAEEAANLRRILNDSDELERLKELEKSNRDILSAYKPADVAREVRRRAAEVQADEADERRRRSAFGRRPLLLAVGAMGAIGLIAVLTDEAGTQVSRGALTGPEEITIKGPTRLVVYRQAGAEEELLSDGGTVHAGDTLQVRYHAERDGLHGVIASRDASGAITLHLPEAPGTAVKLDRKGTTPSAFQLDDTPGFEEFVFITAPRAFDTAMVTEALARDPIALPAPLQVRTVHLRKVPR